MRKLYVILLLLCSSVVMLGQNVFYTKTGHVWFFSSTPVEDIEAHNKKVTAAFDSKNNVLEFKIKMKDFVFDKALMQEHFNENYVESDKYPYATFNGKIENYNTIDFDNLSKQEVSVKGTLKIHGVEQDITTIGNLLKSEQGIHMQAKFQVKPDDYNIKIPKIVVKNIAEIIDVNVDVTVNPLKK